MPIPSATLTIQDGSLGISPPASGNVSVVVGVCTKGTPNTVYGAFRDITVLVATLGYGPAVEDAALQILNGGTVYVVAVDPQYDGALSAVTKVGTGAGTVTVGLAPPDQITVVCVTAGNNGTAAFTYQIGSGPVSAPVVSVAGATWVWKIPGTLAKLTLTQNTGYDLTDAWTVSPVGVVTQTVNGGAGTGALTLTSSQPTDDYTAQVEILSTGLPGVGTFRYTLDSFTDDSGADLSTWSDSILIPAGFKYAIPGSGIFLTFTNSSFTDGDLHGFTSIASSVSTANITAAHTALYAQSSLDYGFVHTVAMSASAAGAATLAGVVDTAMTTAESAFRYIFGIIDVPTVGSRILSGGLPISDTADTDSVVNAAFAGIASLRVIWGAGDFLCTSAINGRLCRRPASWQAAAWAAKLPISLNLHRVKSGPLKSIRKLFRDEGVTQALDSGRFLTLRSHIGKPGYFITRGRTGAASTSDFARLANRRVMDRACQIARAKGVDEIGETVPCNDNGTIKDKSAALIETEINKALTEALVDTGHASAAYVIVSRTANVVSTSTLPISVRVAALGSTDFVEFTLGFVSPSAAAAAA